MTEVLMVLLPSLRILMADEFADRLHILERSGKLGLGTAYIMGFKWSLKQGYDFIFEMDARLQSRS